MKIFKILALPLLFLMASCAEENDSVQEQTAPITIRLSGDAPVVAYPGEKVSYTFDVKYENGLAEAFCRIGNTEVEGSRQTYPDAPVEAQYGFEYVLSDTQAGTTVDFIVEVAGADGISRTYDVPVYVRATKADIIIGIPDEAPSEFLIGSPLEFDVRIASGIDMKHICVYKDEVIMDGYTVETFENPKEYVYRFVYDPAAVDVGAPVIFKFEVMDTRGNIVTQNYSVTFTKPVSLELNEYLNVTMGYQRCTSAGPYFATSTGQVYNIVGAGEYGSIIDIVIYYSGNSSTQGLAITSATSSNATGGSMYGKNAVDYMGGSEADYIVNWTNPITTTFKLLNGSIKGEDASELTPEKFAEINTRQEIVDLWNNSSSKENVVTLMVQPNVILVFKNSLDKYGLIKVNSLVKGNTNTANFDFKVVK